MKASLLLATGMLLCVVASALAQNAAPDKPKEFKAGEPLGTANEAGKFIPISRNVKVYGSFRFAESVTYDPARNLIVVMNAGVPEAQEKNDGYVSLLNP